MFSQWRISFIYEFAGVCLLLCPHVTACIAMIYCGSFLVHGVRCGLQCISHRKAAMEVSHVCMRAWRTGMQCGASYVCVFLPYMHDSCDKHVATYM